MTKNRHQDQIIPIPQDLLNRIDRVEQWHQWQSREKPMPKIALFDLDNTLLVGDCGDALFTQLKLEELEKGPLTIDNRAIPLTWKKYLEVLDTKGKLEAYSMILKCMAGLPLKKLLEASQQVMQSESKFLELEGLKIPIPYPHPTMKALIEFLKFKNYIIYIISATNQHTVRYVAKEFFGIPENNAFGMVPSLKDHPLYGKILGDEIVGPVTVVEGKVEVYKRQIGALLPLISGGDSTTDIMMLNLTNPNGLIIWVGEEEKMFLDINKQFPSPNSLYFFNRKTHSK